MKAVVRGAKAAGAVVVLYGTAVAAHHYLGLDTTETFQNLGLAVVVGFLFAL